MGKMNSQSFYAWTEVDSVGEWWQHTWRISIAGVWPAPGGTTDLGGRKETAAHVCSLPNR